MKLSVDQVRKVTKLANLPVSDGEVEKYSEQLSKILDYIDQLDGVKTDDVEPTYNVTGSYNALSEDIPTPSLSQDEALSNAINKKEGYFATKGIFEEE